MSQIQQFLFEDSMICTKEHSEIFQKRFGENFDDAPTVLRGELIIKLRMTKIYH